ncbi:MAG TPA: TonB-dependent receptor, partial [candidate division Zixibacteria bacterium]|nr:TonB-dependent receptor [candidate division Zixibacteria bacterium]
DVSWDFKQFYNNQPYGEKYNSKPAYFSLFLQDKLEYDFYIINLGLRYDYRKDNVSYSYFKSDGESIIKQAKSISNISPRFGISFPISDRSVMHFNYGVYYQVPRFTYLYTNLQGDVTTGFPLLGNPDLKPERTTSYEIGLNHLLSDDLRIDITVYDKDIHDLVTTRTLESTVPSLQNVTTFTNEDYGSSKGIDVQIEKLPGNGLMSASVSYGYMIANGNGSTAYDPYYSFLTSVTDTIAPVSEFPLDFDQRHTLTAVLDFRVPENYKAQLFGLQIPTNWGIGFVGNYGSGLPYTITDEKNNRVGGRNEGRLPSHYTVDMKFMKNFVISQSRYKLSFFVEVDNLFDKRNVIDVYTNTGRPDEDGNPTTALNSSMSQAEVDYFDSLYDKDPTHYSRPRTIRTGLEFNF